MKLDGSNSNKFPEGTKWLFTFFFHQYKNISGLHPQKCSATANEIQLKIAAPLKSITGI